MTDEEMAEEYAEKHSFRVPYDNSNKFYDDTDFKASKEGFLAGLKAGRPQWHKVADGDLPKENTEVLIYCYGKVRQAFFKGFFKSLYGDKKVEEVVAWKELPVPPKEGE